MQQRSVLFLFLGLLLTLVPGCGGGSDGEEGNIGATAFNGATASLTWTPVNDSNPVTYTVHYGKETTGDFGSCNYEHTLDVSEPSATVTDLEFDMIYYFAVSAYNGLHSSCSSEVSKAFEKPKPHTPPVKEEGGGGSGSGRKPS